MNSHKRALYEPTGAEKCRQIVFSQRKAIIIIISGLAFIFLISLIAAFARPSVPQCVKTEPETSMAEEKVQTYIATDGKHFPWKDIRLPESIEPVSYDIYMHPNLTTFEFIGEVDIVFQAKENVDFVVVHSKHLDIQHYQLTHVDTNDEVKITKFQEYTINEQLYFKLASKLMAGDSYNLNILFKANLSNSLTGFYRSSYKTKNGETVWLATTHFEPTDARAAFPCFDEPSLKATFKMTMVREEKYLSLFNTPMIRSKTLENGLLEDEFEMSVKMSTYLVAFVVCDYGFKSANTSDGVKVSVYAPKEQIDQTQVALDAAVDIIDYYNQYFGVPYPLPKQDLIAIPDFAAGAMENWGLITYRMTALLYDENESSASTKQWVVVVVAHELAHQWFGNLVTMKWWNDLWLNEGFASFTEYLGADHHEPEWRMQDQFLTEALRVGLRSDSLSSSHPISVSVEDPSEINEIFDQISYDKGSSIIRMLDSIVGRDVLQEGLRYYLNEHKYSNAETDDLWAAISKEAKEANKEINVKAMMDTWTRQMGYPVVKVTRERGQVTVSQERFLLNPEGTKSDEFVSPYGYQWQIPLNYITSDEPTNEQGIVWLKDKSRSFPIAGNPDWIKLNVGMKGFYRVHYDSDTWDALVQQLQSDHTVFSPADRASLIDDAFALASAGYLDIKVALAMTKYLVQETEYVPWKIALDNLSYIKLLLEESPDFASFQHYVTQLLKPAIGAVRWEDEGTHLQKYLRELILGSAVVLGHEPSVDRALQMFRDWMKNGTQIKPNLKSIVYRAGIKHGGEDEWQYIWNQYMNTTIPSDKRMFLAALAFTTDSLRLNRYLQMSLNEKKIRKGDTVRVVVGVASSAAGRVLTWHFLRANWDTFKERYGSGSFDMSTLIVRTSSRFFTQYDYDQVKEFYSEHDSGSGKRAVSQALESIEMNIAWLARNKEECLTWLQRDGFIALPENTMRKRRSDL